MSRSSSAKRVCQLRLKRGMTQDEFAVRAGLNRTHLYGSNPAIKARTPRNAKIVADTLDVKITDLVKGV
jgi:transcriptional regulator with XRE-family HTH domain